MKYILKLYWSLYYLFYKIFMNFFSYFLIKFDLYIPLFFKLYLDKSLIFFEKNDYQNSKKINKKIISELIKNNKYLDFFSVFYHQSEDYQFGWDLCKLKYMSQEIIDKVFEFNQKILFTPKSFGKFGHSLLIDLFIRGQMIDILEKKEIIIAGEEKLFSNITILKELFANKVEFQPNFLDRNDNKKIYENCEVNLNYFKTKSGEYLDLRKYFCMLQSKWEKNNFKNYIKLQKNTEKKGLDFLRKYQIDLYKNWYILINVRENENSFKLRNSNFESYMPAINEIIKRGGFVIRYGSSTHKTKNVFLKNFLDLRDNEELNQVLPFLVKNSKFQISTGSGPSVLPMLLDTPNLLTNWSPITHLMGTKKDLLLPKMFFNSNGNVINFHDRLSNKFGSVETNQMAHQLKIEVKDNTEQDIKLAVINMFEKCNNKNLGIDENQKKFKDKMIENNLYPIEICSSLKQTYPDFFCEN